MGVVPPVIHSPELAARIDKASAPLIIDVREPREFEAGHIPGSVNVPLSRFAADFRSIPSNEEVVLVCRSGNRSGQAQAFLRHQGYSHTRNLVSGMIGWTGPVASYQAL